MIEAIYRLIVCHFIGDYVLQSDFLAKSKGTNIWHMISHCFLYSVPFAIVFGFEWQIAVILCTHFIIDSLKARYKKIGYVADQVLHFAVLSIYLY